MSDGEDKSEMFLSDLLAILEEDGAVIEQGGDPGGLMS